MISSSPPSTYIHTYTISLDLEHGKRVSWGSEIHFPPPGANLSPKGIELSRYTCLQMQWAALLDFQRACAMNFGGKSQVSDDDPFLPFWGLGKTVAWSTWTNIHHQDKCILWKKSIAISLLVLASGFCLWSRTISRAKHRSSFTSDWQFSSLSH